jgi:hypothetical protein
MSQRLSPAPASDWVYAGNRWWSGNPPNRHGLRIISASGFAQIRKAFKYNDWETRFGW